MTRTPILTDEEIDAAWQSTDTTHGYLRPFARVIESLLLSRLYAGAEPVAWDIYEHRLYGAPGEKRHRVLWVEHYRRADGTTTDDLDELLAAAKAGAIDNASKTISVRPLYTAAPAQSVPAVKGAWIDGGYVIVTPASGTDPKALKAAILAAAAPPAPAQAGPTDAEMLDWLEKNPGRVSKEPYGTRWVGEDKWGGIHKLTTMRNALRAAMSATSDAGVKP